MIKAEVPWLQRNDLTRLDYDARYAAKYLLCLYINSAVEKMKFKSVHLHQRNTVNGKLVFPSRCGLG